MLPLIDLVQGINNICLARFINPGSINIDRGHWPIMQPGDMGIRAKYIGDTQAHLKPRNMD